MTSGITFNDHLPTRLEYRRNWSHSPVFRRGPADTGKSQDTDESNYTKDNFDYSRSYYFNFLPFYHMGFRTKYPVNDRLTLIYELTNGVQQAENFNGFKSQHFAVLLMPAKSVNWQVNYYFGREQRDVVPQLNPTLPSLPTQPGLSSEVIQPAPRGRLHIRKRPTNVLQG